MSRRRTRLSLSSGSSPTSSAPTRRKARNAIIARLRPQLAAIQGAIAFPFNLPPILGLGNTGGFQYVLEALQGQSPTDVAAVLRGLIVAANQQPELAGVFSTYAADTPQIYLDIDRDKAQVLGVKISDIFNALQSTLGSLLHQRLQRFRPHLAGQYPGRHAVSRTASTTSNESMSATPMAAWCRCRALAEAKLVQGPQTVVRYNGYRGAVVNGAAKPRLQFRPGACRDGAHVRRDAAARLQLRMDRHRVSGKGGERRHTARRARLRHPVRLSVSGRALRELEHPDTRPAVGQRRAYSARSSRWRSPD